VPHLANTKVNLSVNPSLIENPDRLHGLPGFFDRNHLVIAEKVNQKLFSPQKTFNLENILIFQVDSAPTHW